MTSFELTVSRVSVADEIASLLRQRIMMGELRPGMLLRQDEIASQFGASRTPLREALQRLAQDGLVRMDRRGATVVAISLEDLIELYDMRAVLEAMVARDVAPRITDAQLDELASILEELDTSDGERWIELNRRFHNRTYEFSGKPQWIEMIRSLGLRADVYVSLVGVPARRESAAREHQEILSALRARDAERAGHAVAAHLRTTVLTAGAIDTPPQM